MLGITRIEMAKIDCRAEDAPVVMNFGIMDQFALLFGDSDTLLKLDC